MLSIKRKESALDGNEYLIKRWWKSYDLGREMEPSFFVSRTCNLRYLWSKNREYFEIDDVE